MRYTKSEIEQIRNLIVRLKNKMVGVTMTTPTDWGLVLQLDCGVTVAFNWKNIKKEKDGRQRITFLQLCGEWKNKDLRNKEIRNLKSRIGNFDTCNHGISIY